MKLESMQMDVSERLAALRRLDILDTAAEPEYDELVELAAAVCEAPISLLSFIDDHRQWYKAAIGSSLPEKPLELTFCQYTLLEQDALIVEDTRQDPVLAKHPDVVGDPSVRFYAGVAIRTPDGIPIGTLCVADLVPRRISPTQVQTLRVLARQATARLELRDQRRQLQRALQEAEKARDEHAATHRLFRAFVDSGPFITYLKDAEGKIVFHNRTLPETLGLSGLDIIGKTDFDLWPEPYATKFRESELEVMRSGVLQTMEEVSVNPDGTERHWRSYKFPCTAADGSKLLGGISLDITEDLRRHAQVERYQTELEQANELLRELATTDSLTSLPNRRAFDDRLTVEYAVARRSGRPLSVMIVDIDNFKQHNDRYGHDVGDTILRRVASLLHASARETDLVARYGGEEFIILLPDTTEDQTAMVAQRVLSSLRLGPWDLEPITASVGTATLTPATPSKARLVTLADEALYVAKRAGKDRVVSYSAYFKQLVSAIS